ncbi:ribosome biogenesis protein brx1 [Colletotrichum plurivorum]|uniref:Ribosome biogenesis protein brx1 n=1 Tax=Colletotrichum plurivorum TaxID=2175906 RepID=A0A8H6KJI4_9PEZI|nr:ribosome biogenesis protein brx1 [Colletotrichum plurivorum]
MASVYKSLSKSTGQKSDAPASGTVIKANKRRVLLLSSRGVTYRHRHLMNDFATMMPHAKRDVKYDKKGNLNGLNELAELYNCNLICYFEARKGKDLYMWISKAPNGPSCKRTVIDGLVSTQLELHFAGNCLKGSRPLLSWDQAFETEPHLQLYKELFQQMFNVPQGARRSKPFVDHVVSFSYLDGKIWMRQYEIKETEATGDETEVEKSKGGKSISTSLVEIGPRATFTPIITLDGSLGGPVIFESKSYVSPNFVRAELRRKVAAKHNARAEKTVERLSKKKDLGLRSKDGQSVAQDELDTKALFA